MVNAGLWVIRIILYGAAGYLAVFVVYPNINNYLLSFVLGGVLAAAIIAFETLISAKGKQHSFEDEVKQRMLTIDKIMSSQPLSAERQIESGQATNYLSQSIEEDYEDAEIIDDDDQDSAQAEVVDDVQSTQRPHFPEYRQ